MLKILIIFLLIVVGIIAMIAYALGAVRRLLGLSPKQASTIYKGFKNMRAPGFKNSEEPVQKDILYQKDNVVVLRGEAKEKVRNQK